MGYKPTLGGLKKAQEFLDLKGILLPVFEMDIYRDGTRVAFRWAPGKGRIISIDDAIQKYGAGCEVVDVRFTDERGDSSIVFSDNARIGMFSGIDARESGWDAIVEYHSHNHSIEDFMDSADGTAFVKLARWGKPKPSILDRLKFYLFPTRYAAEVFV